MTLFTISHPDQPAKTVDANGLGSGVQIYLSPTHGDFFRIMNPADVQSCAFGEQNLTYQFGSIVGVVHAVHELRGFAPTRIDAGRITVDLGAVPVRMDASAAYYLATLPSDEVSLLFRTLADWIGSQPSIRQLKVALFRDPESEWTEIVLTVLVDADQARTIELWKAFLEKLNRVSSARPVLLEILRTTVGVHFESVRELSDIAS